MPGLETVSGSVLDAPAAATAGGANLRGGPRGGPWGGSPGGVPPLPLLPTGRDLGRGSVDVREESYIQEGSVLTRRYLLRRSAD